MPRYTQPRKTWSYSKDFKVKAVKLSLQDGIQVKQVAEGLDFTPSRSHAGEKSIGKVSCRVMVSGGLE